MTSTARSSHALDWSYATKESTEMQKLRQCGPAGSLMGARRHYTAASLYQVPQPDLPLM